MDDRLCMANMAIEAGAKNGIFEVDEQTNEFLRRHRSKVMKKSKKVYKPDKDAEYDAVYEIDLSKIRSTVAFPHLPENARTINKVGNIKIDQVVIGSCTNGRPEDMEVAAKILKGRKVAPGVRCIIIPGTQGVMTYCVEKGWAKIFLDAGCVFSTPTCGPCLGGHMGVLAAGEKAVSTTNRNFIGRMGHTESEIYLASPAVAAASAVKGRIFDPAKL
jgi:3-isopropylmalate/(R)-2-methylmalate dehydratase large subunit